MPFLTPKEQNAIAKASRIAERRRLKHERKLALQKIRLERHERLKAHMKKFKWAIIIILGLVAGIIAMLKFG